MKITLNPARAMATVHLLVDTILHLLSLFAHMDIDTDILHRCKFINEIVIFCSTL